MGERGNKRNHEIERGMENELIWSVCMVNTRKDVNDTNYMGEKRKFKKFMSR